MVADLPPVIPRAFLGPIEVPTPPTIAQFPITPDYGTGADYTPPIVTHQFGQAGLKTEQRFLAAPKGPRRFRFIKDHLSCTEYDNLKAHWEQAQGVYAQFPLVMNEPTGPATYTVRYENPALAFQYMVALLTQGPGLTFLEQPETTATYSSRARLNRFPDSSLTTALQSEFQQIIPLVSITTRDGSAAVYVSNQACQIDSTIYQPRMLDWSGISQTLGENSDAGSFNFGNADGVFTQLVNQYSLYAASVQLSLYHVQDQSIIDVWAGFLTNWVFDTSGKFQINVSDGTFFMTLPYPSRKILRTCWKVYKGMWCPSTSSLPDCPKDFGSCVARGVPQSFGGIIFPIQSVTIMDSSTGVFGFGRSAITSVSVVDDTVYQRPIQEAFTDEQMLVTCDVGEGRDESSFYSALGVVSEGPIVGFDPDLMRSTLDGQPPHDPLHGGGWRGLPGTDPANVNDWVGIDQAPWPRTIKGWVATAADLPQGGAEGDTWITSDTQHMYVLGTDALGLGFIWTDMGQVSYAAGIAMAEIRRTDQAGLQLTAVSEHSMVVSIVGGIGGWVWSGPGARTWVNALSNPIWVGVNVYLRALGLRCDPSNASLISPAVMEQYFDVNQCVAMAAICDTKVPTLIGSGPAGDGTEIQFPFRGVLKEQKPVRDWLREIVNNCSGNWIFSNGKLWPIVRVNSSVLAGNAFTEATILFRSLQVSPLQPAFNWLVGNFADSEFGWQLNNVTMYDIDHASFLGTPEAPQYLVQTMNFIGVSNLSQCARLCTARLREELGGLASGSGPHGTDSNVNEQLIARNFQFKTTLLALGTQLGDIVSLTHPALPYTGGYAEGRVARWALNPDFSIDLQVSCTTDDMYDLTVGPKPQDIAPPAPPPEQLAAATGLCWMPNTLAPQAGDPVCPQWERTFNLWQQYEIDAGGNWQPTIWVQGEMTIDQYAYPSQARILEIELASGGTLNGPQTVYVAVTQRDANGAPNTPSNLSGIWIPADMTSQQVNITVAADANTNLTDYDVWAGNDRRQLALQFSGTGAPPTAISLPGPLHNWTQGAPDGNARSIKVQAKHVWHAGIAGLLVNAVIGTNQIQCNDFLNSSDNWIGQLVFVCSNVDGDVPLWNFKITAFDAPSATLTVSPDCAGNADDTQNVREGDVLIVYSSPTAATANTITNTMWDNSVNRQQYPGSSGMVPHQEAGRIVRILRNTGAGQWRVCSDNDQYTHTVSPPWDVIPDSTSLYIVEDPGWEDSAQTSQIVAPTTGVSLQVGVEVPNLPDEVVLVGGFLVDANGDQTDDQFACYRMIYVFGQPPSVATVGPDPGPYDIDVTDQTIRVDSSANDVSIALPPLATYQGRTLLIWNSGPNNAVIDTTAPDTFPDGSTELVLTGAGATARITAGGIYTT